MHARIVKRRGGAPAVHELPLRVVPQHNRVASEGDDSGAGWRWCMAQTRCAVRRARDHTPPRRNRRRRWRGAHDAGRRNASRKRTGRRHEEPRSKVSPSGTESTMKGAALFRVAAEPTFYPRSCLRATPAIGYVIRIARGGTARPILAFLPTWRRSAFSIARSRSSRQILASPEA